MTDGPLLPNKTVGILGGGQLGKMLLVAARQLGYHVTVWDPDPAAPAVEMATHRIVAPFTDSAAYKKFHELADVVTTEWENIPKSLLEQLENDGSLVCPSSHVLATAQSRHAEKSLARALGLNPVPWEIIHGLAGLQSSDSYQNLFPGVLKTNWGGYDGKGQAAISDYRELSEAMLGQSKITCVLEQRIDFDYEASAIVARNAHGEMHVSPAVINAHAGGILAHTMWTESPCSVKPLDRIPDMMRALATRLELIGILAVEFMVRGDKIWFNEMAPRPHNSFHGSIEAAYCSQFEQHIRAICGLPLGRLKFHSEFDMYNLIGDGWIQQWSKYMERPGARVHFYGKAESRPGRKMGHVTILNR